MTQKTVKDVARFKKLMNIMPPLDTLVRVTVPEWDTSLINVDYLMENWGDCSRAVDYRGVVYGYVRGDNRSSQAEVYLTRWFYDRLTKARDLHGKRT